ncbi:MAG: class I SAM-dependent methyltransferase [Phycisphaerales bacterium]
MLRRALWKLAPLFGPAAARWAWNDQFARGKWDYLKARDHRVTELIAKLANGGAVVDLGCGEGNLAFDLPAGSYERYIGVDVSSVAIERANHAAYAKANSRCEFRCADLRTWEGESGADVILIEEALYYLAPTAQAALLDACERSLTPGGSLVIIVHDEARHARTIALIESRYGAQARHETGGSRACYVAAVGVAQRAAA